MTVRGPASLNTPLDLETTADETNTCGCIPTQLCLWVLKF